MLAKLAKLSLIAGVGALLVALLAMPIGSFIAGPVVTAWEVAAPAGADASAIEANREIFLFDPPAWFEGSWDSAKPEQVQAVLSFYGNPGSEPQHFIWLEDADVIHPPEMPDVSLVLQDYSKPDGKRWKASFVWFFIPKIGGGAALTGILFLGLWFWLKKRSARAGAAPAA